VNKHFTLAVIMPLVALLIASNAYSRDELLVTAAPSIWAGTPGSQLEGTVIELTTQMFSELNVTIKGTYLPWNRALEYMKEGKVDVIATIFHTDERAKYMDFSIPYVKIPTVIVVAKGKTFPFKKLNDLVGLQGLMSLGASLGKSFNHFAPNLNILQVTNETQIIGMLTLERADYGIGSKYIFLSHAKKSGKLNDIEFLPTPVNSRGLRFGISKKSPFIGYLETLNKKIKQGHKSGLIESIVTRSRNKATK